MTTSYLCTYCGDDLGDLDAHGPGETLHCETCDVEFDLVHEHEAFDLVVFVCPYCGYDNKRSQGVDQVRCENDDRLDDPAENCGLLFDPVGAATRPVEDHEERVKMVPKQGGEA